MIIDDILSEALYGLNIDNDGKIHTQTKYIQPYSVLNKNITDRIEHSKPLEKKWKPDPWQEKIFKSLQNGSDNIILVPPGAGKTYPVMGSYMTLFNERLKYPKRGDFFADLETKDFPRLAYVVPTKQLAVEMFNQELQRNSEFGLFRLLTSNMSSIMRHSAGIGIRPPTDIETDTIDTNHQNFIYSLSNKLISMQNGGSNFDDIFYSAGIPKPIVVGTYNKIKELLKKYGDWYNVVVVDESQQFIPLPTDNYMTKDMLDKISSFLEIVKYSKSNKKGGCVQLMTGSVNLKSLTDIQTMLNTNFSDTRKFFMKAYGNNTAVDTEFGDGDKDVINPETGKRIKIGNRADIVVMPYEKLSGMATDSRKAIIDIVHRKISEKNYWNVIAIFGAKRTAQKGIYRIIEEAIDG